ncbi:MAG: hypothetical protein ACKPB8_09690 [Alphaproteobacteria bacterium]|jgi:hypothetical protein
MRALPLALLLLLTACAERWEKPGATEADSDAAQATCTAQAAEEIKPAMVWMQVQPAYWEPGETRCWTSPNGVTNCTRRPPRLRPPIYDWVDVNIPIRQEARAKCLNEQGFTYKGLRPLRLF